MTRFKEGDLLSTIRLTSASDPTDTMRRAHDANAILTVVMATGNGYRCTSPFFKGDYFYAGCDIELYQKKPKDYSDVDLVTYDNKKDLQTVSDIIRVTGHSYHEDLEDHYELIKFIKKHTVEYLRKKEAQEDKKSEETKKQTENGAGTMLNIQSIVGQFGEVTNGAFKLSMQGIAIKTGKDSYAIYDKENGRMVDVMDFVTDADGMLFQLPTQLAQLKENDIIDINNKPAIVKSVNVEEKSVLALDPATSNEFTHKFPGNLFGFEFVTKITTIFEAMGGVNPLAPTQGGAQPAMNPLLMMTLLGKDSGSSKMKDLLPLLMMQGNAGGNAQMQQMLPFLLMKDGGSSKMMEMMMLSQMMGGQGANPFAFMQPAQAPVTPAE